MATIAALLPSPSLDARLGGLLIEIPVHSEEGWTTHCSTPEGLVKESSRPTPADLKLREVKAEQRARAALQAKQERAIRENQRAAEVKKHAIHASKRAAEVLRDASKQRLWLAEARREKILRMRKEKGAFEANHALAVASTIKRERNARSIEADESLTNRLEAAAVRRLSFSSPKSQIESATGSPAVLKAIEKRRNEWKIDLEIKRVRLNKALEKAAERREYALTETAQRGRAVSERIMEIELQHRERKETERHHIFEKLQAACFRHEATLAARAHKVSCPPMVIDIPISKGTDSPPQQLLLRLCLKPMTLALTASARQARAAAIREEMSLMQQAKAVRHAERIARAAANRVARIAAIRSKAEALHASARIRVVRMTLTRAANAAYFGSYLVQRAAAVRKARKCAKLEKAEKHAKVILDAQFRRDSLLAFRSTQPNESVMKVVDGKLLSSAEHEVLRTLAQDIGSSKACMRTRSVVRAEAAKVNRAMADVKRFETSHAKEKRCVQAEARRSAVLADRVKRAKSYALACKRPTSGATNVADQNGAPPIVTEAHEKKFAN